MVDKEDRIEWIGDRYEVEAGSELSKLRSGLFFRKCALNDMTIQLGDFVCIHNYDVAKSDSYDECELGKVMGLFEDISMKKYALIQYYSRPSSFNEKMLEDSAVLRSMDMQHELIEDYRYALAPLDISDIFDVAKMLTPKKECELTKNPEARFFCNYKCEKAAGKKYRLAPIVPIVEPIKLKTTDGKWTKKETTTYQTPSRRISSTKKIGPSIILKKTAPIVILKKTVPIVILKKTEPIVILKDVFASNWDVDEPPNKKRRSLKTGEDRTPSTPKTPARRLC